MDGLFNILSDQLYKMSSKPMSKRLSQLVPAVLLIALSPLLAHAGGIKKWVDADGVVHYGTTIPPEYINQDYTELNQRGIETRHVKRAKTPEEIAREHELAELRKAQQQAIAEQRAKDRILLNMFRSEDDLVMARDGKLAQVDAQIKLKQAHIDRLKQRLSKWQAAAAARERKGKKPTPKQIENLENLQKQLENAYASIVEKESDKRRISLRYARELKRFRQLKSGFRASSTKDIEPEKKVPRILPVPGAFVCQDRDECDRKWPGAVAWVRKHSDTPVEIIGERILVTRTPEKPDEVSLTLSRLSRGGVERLFLDLNCHKSIEGKQHCQAPKVQALRSRFVEAMTLDDPAL
jgi:hypothetical protein